MKKPCVLSRRRGWHEAEASTTRVTNLVTNIKPVASCCGRGHTAVPSLRTGRDLARRALGDKDRCHPQTNYFLTWKIGTLTSAVLNVRDEISAKTDARGTLTWRCLDARAPRYDHGAWPRRVRDRLGVGRHSAAVTTGSLRDLPMYTDDMHHGTLLNRWRSEETRCGSAPNLCGKTSYRHQ